MELDRALLSFLNPQGSSPLRLIVSTQSHSSAMLTGWCCLHYLRLSSFLSWCGVMGSGQPDKQQKRKRRRPWDSDHTSEKPRHQSSIRTVGQLLLFNLVNYPELLTAAKLTGHLVFDPRSLCGEKLIACLYRTEGMILF